MGNAQWYGGPTDNRRWDRTDRQAAERKSLGLGLGPNINPKAARTEGEENKGTEDPTPTRSSIRYHQIPS